MSSSNDLDSSTTMRTGAIASPPSRESGWTSPTSTSTGGSGWLVARESTSAKAARSRSSVA
eukprot:2394685-Prymnesium_polylepis.1